MTDEKQRAVDNFKRLTRRQQFGDIDFKANTGGSGDDGLNIEKLIAEKDRYEGNSVSSRVAPFAKLRATDDDPIEFVEWLPNGDHRVCIDLDMDAALIPTTTPGHHHLIIDHEMSWEDYKKLLDVLLDVGLIQPGYHRASIERGASWLRCPWTPKEIF